MFNIIKYLIPIGLYIYFAKNNYCMHQLAVFIQNKKEYWGYFDLFDGFMLTFNPARRDKIIAERNKKRNNKSEKITRNILDVFNKNRLNIVKDDKKYITSLLADELLISDIEEILNEKME